MKIIKRAEKPKKAKKWSGEFKCRCGATLLVNEDDFCVVHDDGDYFITVFTCPCCGAEKGSEIYKFLPGWSRG